MADRKLQSSEFGKRLKEAFQNIQNKEIAKRIGVSDPAVSGYMTGNFPSVEKLVEISKMTGFSIDWLLTGKGKKYLKSSNPNPTSILVCGYKSGIGTSVSACFIALSLALIGKKVLVIDNRSSGLFSNLAYNLFFEENSGRNLLKTNENVYIQSYFPNIEIFLRKGFPYWSGSKERLKPFNKSIFQIKEEYDFIISDVPSEKNPFRCSELTFNAALDNSKILIPYQPTRSSINDVNTILKFIDAEKKIGFQTEFLGLFINNEGRDMRKKDYYLGRLEEIEHLIQDKMFKKVIKDVSPFGEDVNLDFRMNLESIKKKKLVKQYSELTQEILARLA